MISMQNCPILPSHVCHNPGACIVPPLDLSRRFSSLTLAVKLHLLPRLHHHLLPLLGLHNVGLPWLTVHIDAGHIGLDGSKTLSSTHLIKRKFMSVILLIKNYVLPDIDIGPHQEAELDV